MLNPPHGAAMVQPQPRCFWLESTLTACLALLIAGGALASEPVYVAGFAYLGDLQYIDTNYAEARRLDRDTQVLQRTLREHLQRLTPEHVELRFELGDLDRTSTIVMAVALDRERVSRERFAFRQGERTKLIVEASLQLIFYDLATGALVDNIPVSAAINHVLTDDAQLASETTRLARLLYLGGDDFNGLLQQAANALRTFKPRTEDGLRFQLTALDLHERTAAAIPRALPPDQIRQSLGQSFSARLAEQTPVSVVPFARGYAIGNQLPGRFSNGEAFNLTLPEPDYAFAIELKNFTQHVQEDKRIFAVQAFLRFTEPFTGTTLIASDYRMGIYKLESTARIESDDWSAYQDSVDALFDAFIEQLKKPDRAWHRQHARAKESFRQFEQAGELFQ